MFELLVYHPIYFTLPRQPTSCVDLESYIRGDSTLTKFFLLVEEGREVPNTTISGPLLARKRSAIEKAFCWRAVDGPTLNADLVAL